MKCGKYTKRKIKTDFNYYQTNTVTNEGNYSIPTFLFYSIAKYTVNMCNYITVDKTTDL